MKKLIIKAVGSFINLTAVLAPKWSANYSFDLLCKVKRAGISEKGMAFLSQAKQTYFEIEGQSSVLHKWGNGPKKILFLHGWLSNSQRWMPYAEKINPEEYTIYALDAPGHGMSKSNILNLEIYRLAIEKALETIGQVNTVICHSFSNTAMTYLYLMNPKVDIKKYVVMGSPSGMDAIFVYFEETLGLSQKAMNNLDKKITHLLKIPHQEILVKNLLNVIDKPTLVIHDKNDRITPFAPIKQAIKDNPRLDTLITEGLKHDLKSDKVYHHVIDFIKLKS